MPQRSAIQRWFFLVLGLGLWLGAAAVGAQTAGDQGTNSGNYQPARPVYLDVRPIGGAESLLDKGLVEAMAQEALSSIDESVIRMRGDALPPSVRVLRVMYIAHQQPKPGGVVMAASAKIDLLRTRQDRSDTVLATSIYSGVQQSMIQGANENDALEGVRESFKKSLVKRIKQAFTDSAAN